MNEITEKKTVFTVYSHDEDMTFIMEDTYDAYGEPLSTECVGWYNGAPNDEDTALYTGKLKAEYLMGREKDEQQAEEGKKNTFRVVYEYKDGRKGVCLDPFKPVGINPIEFATEQEATAYAAELTARIPEDLKHLFPVHRVERAEREANYLYLKGMMKSHEEWKAKHPRPKK